MKSSSEKVNEFLVDIQSTFPDKYETVEKIRRIFIEENPVAEEDIKYGGVVFIISGQLVGGIFIYKQHISVEFSSGANFIDSKGELEGKGKLRRHIKLLEISDIENKNIKFFISQAVA